MGLGHRIMRTILVNISFAVVTLIAGDLAAQSTPVAAPTKNSETNPSDKPAPRKTTRSAVARVAEAIATDIAHVPGRALVVTSPLTTDTPAPRATDLALLVAQQVAGRRGAGTRAFEKPQSLADARMEARIADVLVMLKVEVATGKLRVVSDVFPIPKTVWARVRDPEPGPIAHAFAEAPIDAEVRTYLAPVPMTQVDVTRAQNFENDVVAIACADLDADGSNEIITVSRRRVTTVRLREGKVIPLRSRNWSDLAAFAPVPLREPLGFAALGERSSTLGSSEVFLDVGLSDRTKSVRLDGTLDVVATLSGLPLGFGENRACVRVNQPWLGGAFLPCMKDETAMPVVMPGAYDAFAAGSFFSSEGETFVVVAGRNDRGLVDVRDDAGHATSVDGAGAQLAVGDLDQDGAVEILSSLDVPASSTDAIVVRSWLRRTAGEPVRPKELFRIPAAAGVRALGVCPPDGPGRTPFVVATTDEVWVVR